MRVVNKGVSLVNLVDNLFNWLQIKLVADQRPEDLAARDTVAFFAEMLKEDHGVDTSQLSYEVEASMIHVLFVQEGKKKRQLFDREAAEKLLRDIEREPRYGL